MLNYFWRLRIIARMSSALLLEVDEDSCLAGASFAGSSQGASSSAAFGAGLAVLGSPVAWPKPAGLKY
jgi:hypothetical protein